MTFALISVVSFVVVLGLLVLIHEFGHYATAKLFGVRVEVFSIGFGNRLFGFKKGDTDYRIAALPFGGYVKMSGENPLEPSTGDPGEFMSHPRWQRFIIAAAGPVMNILFAVALLTGMFMFHYEHAAFLNEPATIGWVVDGSPADTAGLQVGDRVIRADNVQNPTWQDMLFQSVLDADQPMDLAVQRGSQVLHTKLSVPMDRQTRQPGDPGWVPADPIRVTDVEKDFPAAKAGLQTGDEIVEIDGHAVRSLAGIHLSLEKSQSSPVTLTVVRSGNVINLPMQPVFAASVESNGEKYWRLGFTAPPRVTVEKLGFGAALGKSIDDNVKFSGMLFELLHRLVQGRMSIKQFDGPIGIGRAAGQAAQEKGWLPLVQLTSMISLNLGIFNLLPIPIMDGGVILLLLIEGVMRRDINARLKERIYQAAFVFLVLFAVVVIYNDIAKIPTVSKFFGQ
jgi:regulator of sigma E protease